MSKFLLMFDLLLSQFGLTRLTAAFALLAGIALLVAAYMTARMAWKTWYAGRAGLAGAEFALVGVIALALMAGLVYPISRAMDYHLAQLGTSAPTGAVFRVWLLWGVVAMFGVFAIILVFTAMIIRARPKPADAFNTEVIDMELEFVPDDGVHYPASGLRDARRAPTHNGLTFGPDDFV